MFFLRPLDHDSFDTPSKCDDDDDSDDDDARPSIDRDRSIRIDSDRFHFSSIRINFFGRDRLIRWIGSHRFQFLRFGSLSSVEIDRFVGSIRIASIFFDSDHFLRSRSIDSSDRFGSLPFSSVHAPASDLPPASRGLRAPAPPLASTQQLRAPNRRRRPASPQSDSGPHARRRRAATGLPSDRVPDDDDDVPAHTRALSLVAATADCALRVSSFVSLASSSLAGTSRRAARATRRCRAPASRAARWSRSGTGSAASRGRQTSAATASATGSSARRVRPSRALGRRDRSPCPPPTDRSSAADASAGGCRAGEPPRCRGGGKRTRSRRKQRDPPPKYNEPR